MAPTQKPHFLIKTIYLPRVLAYGLALMVTLPGCDKLLQRPLLLVAVGFILLYPHLAHLITLRWFNSASGAKWSMVADGLVVSLLICLNDMSLLPATSFVSALAISSLMIAEWPVVLINLGLMLVLCGWGASFFPAALEGSWPELLSAVSIIFYSSLVAGLGFRVTRALGYGRKSSQREQVEAAGLVNHLKQYVAPQLHGDLSLAAAKGTRRKCLTVFFSDIEGFTELTDRLAEETVTRILNEYLNAMSDIADEFGGTIDKFMGDGMMVFFGDPVSRGSREDAKNCISMALAMRQRLQALRHQWREEGIFSELHIRIGIHTGYCAVGNFGSEQHRDYTAIGSTVNIASRLEGQAGRDGILISEDTWRLVRNGFVCQRQQPLQLRGIVRPLVVYGVSGLKVAAEVPLIRECAGFRLELDPGVIDPAVVLSMLQESLAGLSIAVSAQDPKQASEPAIKTSANSCRHS